jgi:hypothetical protein
MSWIGDALLDCLRSVDRPGDYRVGDQPLGLRPTADLHARDRRRRCWPDLVPPPAGALVATKNQASYERRAKQRRQDLEYVAALAG